MLLSAFFAARRYGILVLLALGLLIGALEGGFVLLLKQALAGGPPWLSSWGALMAAAFALVTARTAVQWGAARRETSLVYGWTAEKRADLLRLAAARRFPAYRDPWRSALTGVLDRGLSDLADGLAAALRCGTALAQAAVLLPLLLLFAWKPALAALALFLPALWISRVRAASLRAGAARHGASTEALARAVDGFADGLETSAGNGRLAGACAALSGERARHEGAAEAWELAKARFPPLLEWLFFAALAGLLGVAAAAGDGTAEWTASLLPFAALLLLLHRPIREWARHHPARLPGERAWEAYRNLYATLEARPAPAPAPASPGPTLRAEGIRFAYGAGPGAGHGAEAGGGVPVFAGLDAELDPEAVTWVPGPNGSGKSTFLKLLAGLETPQAGRILLPARLRAAPQAFAYLPQRAVIEPDWLAWARAFARGQGGAWGALEEILALRDLMARAGGAHGREGQDGLDARAWAATLSGGQRQRLALARVFASDAPCLLLDEPTTWLAAGDRERIMGDLLAFRKGKGGRGAVLVSHEPFLGEFAAATLRLEEADDRRFSADRADRPDPPERRVEPRA